MIGEPEIDGDWDTARPGEELRSEPGPAREGVRGPRAPWLWALGGALLASAAWAGTLAVQDRFFDASPPTLAYRHSADLCKDIELKVLGQAAARPFESYGSSEGVHPAQDWASCGFGMKWDAKTTTYAAQVLVELHKKTDPRVEFGTGPGGHQEVREALRECREVAGLGERAVICRLLGAGGDEIQVLDGGAVFTLTAHWYGTPDGPAVVDEDLIDAALVEDVRAVMARLRK